MGISERILPLKVPERTLPQTTDNFADQAGRFLMTWTPRVIVAAIAGYYSLGIAYEMGIMAAIDQVAISVLKDSVGYAGLGAVMPTFQWYSAWGYEQLLQQVLAYCTT